MPAYTYPGVHITESRDYARAFTTFRITQNTVSTDTLPRTETYTITNQELYHRDRSFPIDLRYLYETYYSRGWADVLVNYSFATSNSDVITKLVPQKSWRDQDREPTEEDRIVFMRLLDE